MVIVLTCLLTQHIIKKKLGGIVCFATTGTLVESYQADTFVTYLAKILPRNGMITIVDANTGTRVALTITGINEFLRLYFIMIS